MRVQEVMTQPAPVVPAGTDRAAALRHLALSRAPALIVTDARGEACGLLTTASLQGNGVEALPALPLVALGQRDSLSRAVSLMLQHRVHHVAVLEGRRPVGLLTRDQILAVLRQAAPDVPARGP